MAVRFLPTAVTDVTFLRNLLADLSIMLLHIEKQNVVRLSSWTSVIVDICSHDGRYIICGSEDQSVYIWRTQHEFYKFSSARRDRNDYWENVKGWTAFLASTFYYNMPYIRAQIGMCVHVFTILDGILYHTTPGYCDIQQME